jgi:hypothetical protein
MYSKGVIGYIVEEMEDKGVRSPRSGNLPVDSRGHETVVDTKSKVVRRWLRELDECAVPVFIPIAWWIDLMALFVGIGFGGSLAGPFGALAGLLISQSLVLYKIVRGWLRQCGIWVIPTEAWEGEPPQRTQSQGVREGTCEDEAHLVLGALIVVTRRKQRRKGGIEVRRIEQNEDSIVSSCGNRIRFVANMLGSTIQNVISILKDVLHYPLLLALFGLNIVVIIPGSIGLGITFFGILWPVSVLLFQMPAISLIVIEVRRQMKSLPPTETFETSPERWNQVLTEFVSDVKEETT